jgi:hypothetical protein
MALRAGIDCAQGYLFCHPVGADAVGNAVTAAEQVMAELIITNGSNGRRAIRPPYKGPERRLMPWLN